MSSKQWHGGKGDTPRTTNDEVYRSNWDRIFGGIDYSTVDTILDKPTDTINNLQEDNKK